MDPLSAPRWLWVVLVAAIVIAHALVIGRVTSHITLPIASAATVVVLILLMHSTFIGIIHTLLRRWRTR
jgi:hypothetical protein